MRGAFGNDDSICVFDTIGVPGTLYGLLETDPLATIEYGQQRHFSIRDNVR